MQELSTVYKLIHLHGISGLWWTTHNNGISRWYVTTDLDTPKYRPPRPNIWTPEPILLDPMNIFGPSARQHNIFSVFTQCQYLHNWPQMVKQCLNPLANTPSGIGFLAECSCNAFIPTGLLRLTASDGKVSSHPFQEVLPHLCFDRNSTNNVYQVFFYPLIEVTRPPREVPACDRLPAIY